MKTKTKTGNAAPRRRHRFSFLTVHNPFKTSGGVQTPKRKVVLRSWLKRVADCTPALQMVGEDGNVFVTTLDGLPHPIGTRPQLRALSAEQMEEVLAAVNDRLPSSLSVSFSPGDRPGLLAILEDLLGYSQSETPKAPRRSSISTVTPRTPLSPLVNGRDVPAMSPFQFVHSPSAPCASPDRHSSPTRLAAARALHGITALLIPPPAGIPAPLLNGHAQHLRSLEPPSTPTRSACDSPLFTPLSRKRMLEPVMEDVRAEQEGEHDAARGKRRRTVSGIGGAPAEEVGTLRRTKTTGSLANANAERRVTRALAARMAVENMRVTRSMSATANLSTSVSWSPRRPPRPARNPARRDSVASTSSQSTVGGHTLPPATSRSSTPTQQEPATVRAQADEEVDAAEWSASSSPIEMRDALSAATLKAFPSAIPTHGDDADSQGSLGTEESGVLAAAEVEYEASVSDGESDAASVSVHTDTSTDESSASESSTPCGRDTGCQSSSSYATPLSGRDEDVFNGDADAATDDENDAYARLKSASIWFRSPDSDASASDAPSSPCARLADRSLAAESTPRASTWMFVTQTRRRGEVSPVRINGAAHGHSRIPRGVTSPQADRGANSSRLFLQRSPRSAASTAQCGKMTRSAFVGSSPAGSLFSPVAASPVTRARSLILPSSPVALGTATASPLARSAVGNAFRSASRARARSNSDVSTPSSRASDWRAPTASPTPRGRSRLPKAVV